MEACTKIPYPTLGRGLIAARAIARACRRRGCARVPKGIHWCALCTAWHVTSHPVKAAWCI